MALTFPCRMGLALASLAALGAGCAPASSELSRSAARVSAIPLLSTGETILGQPISYPQTSTPHVTVAIVTLEPGASTGWHHHSVPLVAYMLEGKLTVDYEGHGERIYRAGDALVEAIGTPHEGRNSGDGIVRILAAFAGAEGTPNTESVE
jgi:quercetin dioxygenase-like cupin family protein